MPRIIDPPLDQLPNLPTPLTEGEWQVLDLFNAKLPEAWEIYVQPHFNGLRPDFVLLNPNVGIAVFEVKDWDLDAIAYRPEMDAKRNRLMLMAYDRRGRTFAPENPIDKVRLYKSEIYDLYCPDLPQRHGMAAVTAGVIFTNAPSSRADQLLRVFHSQMECKYRRYFPIAGMDDVSKGNIGKLFPEWNRRISSLMNEIRAGHLRGWLKEPDFSREQREPLELDQRQHQLATTRTPGGYRRVKGPAGSGKTVALAARAAQLADEGKRVLVVAYNITLMNYIKDLAVRHRTGREAIRRKIDFLYFHAWCRRVCEESGRKSDYNSLWSGNDNSNLFKPEENYSSQFRGEVDVNDVLERRLPQLVQRIYDGHFDGSHAPYYDAILVDEGQDFRLLWWATLRKALKPGGEMLIVADKTQNVYGTASAWTDVAMTGAGFHGEWFRLAISYRLPQEIVPILHRYADEFLTSEEVDIPNQIAFSGPTDLRWVQINPATSVASAARVCVAQTRRQMKNLLEDTANPDIVFLSPNDEIGREFIREFGKYNIDVVHTFAQDDRESRKQKLAFFKGAPNIKATTLHSFKGWESRHLVVYVDEITRPTDRALLYTALTRLKRHENGSALTVVSSCPELREFGKNWPGFIDIDLEQNPPVLD